MWDQRTLSGIGMALTPSLSRERERGHTALMPRRISIIFLYTRKGERAYSAYAQKNLPKWHWVLPASILP
jgi:hypothetical protein